jgi:penicillin-binding protein 2
MLIVDQLKRGDAPLRVLSISVLVGVGILLAGLWYLQVVTFKRYLRSQKTQSIRTVRIPAIRGEILDRHGVPLAENRPCYDLDLYVEELSPLFRRAFRREHGPVAHRTLSRAEFTALGRQTRYQVASNVVEWVGRILHQPLPLDPGRFLKHYTNRLALPLPLVEDLTPRQVALFQEQPGKPPGVVMEVQPLRVYPHGDTAAHVLGHLRYLPEGERPDEDLDVDFKYSLPDYKGVIGIEGVYDDYLRGKAGAKAVLVNSIGYRQSEDTWLPAAPGQDVVLTIDLRIQEAAQRALASAGPDVHGAVVVLDPRDGDILALVSLPTYNPNDFVPRLASAEMQKLNDPKRRPLVNRATAENYPAGSIFKIVVALAGMVSGTLDPTAIYHSLGYYPLGHRLIGDLAPAGDYDFRRAFKKSSNSYFIDHGLLAGVDNIVKIARRFHLGERTGIPILQETSGLLPSPAWKLKTVGEPWRPGDTANLSIGQGYLDVTPLQMAIMTAAIANGGRVFWPRLVMRIQSPDPDSPAVPITFPTGRLRDRLGVPDRDLSLIRDAMLADVEDQGTGTRAFVTGMRICGKTGTAQAKRNGRSTRDVWFVSFADYDHPRYVVVVMVEGGGSGGGTCAPVARRIYETLHKLESLDRTGGGALASAALRRP